MSDFVNRLHEKVIAPADQLRRSVTIIARVLESNEKNNTCKIEYIDKNGKTCINDSVQVRLYSQSIIDWFPQKDELVYVEHDDHIFKILSKYDGGYASSIRPSTMLKKDILSDSILNYVCGSIF